MESGVLGKGLLKASMCLGFRKQSLRGKFTLGKTPAWGHIGGKRASLLSEGFASRKNFNKVFRRD